MIVFGARGGLANQLFQYATARSLALLRNTEVVADPALLAIRHPGVTPREYELGHYRAAVRLPTTAEAAMLWPLRNRVLRRIAVLHKWKLVREKSSGCFDPSVLESPDGSYLDGYWGVPKYFERIREILLMELQPKAEMSSADEDVANQISRTNSIAVHVRRGDYVTLPVAAQYHGTCSLDYYRASIEALRANISDPVLYVFSDDPAWTRENLHLDVSSVYVTHNTARNAFQDLRLMSLCKHNIIANSSFSWWGAWLGTFPQKRVCAPRRWFSGSPASADMFPSSWQIIDA